MIRDWSLCYSPAVSHSTDTGSVKAWLSASISDPLWDDFLRSTPCGQFQQSSLWAEYKASEGWKHHRVILTDAAGIVGGFQILWKQSRLGRMGYVSKGPVLGLETDENTKAALDRLRDACRTLGLMALIAQPPDESRILPSVLQEGRFLPNKFKDIVRTTLLLDLTSGMKKIESGMSSSARMEVKQAKRREAIVREGDTADISIFFGMIEATCLRQKTKPNPATEENLGALWALFKPHGARIMIAQCRGEDVAGQLCIPFGGRVTIWKKGWTGQHRDCHPNRLLIHTGLEWACAKGLKYWDYAALDPGIAASMLAGKPLSDEQKRSRHMFHLGFGGEARLLPESRIWIGNPLVRLGYRLFSKTVSP